jgi:hypothetical protein
MLPFEICTLVGFPLLLKLTKGKGFSEDETTELSNEVF